MEIPFEIDHIDPLGQGVSKTENTVTFIKKSLPGEKGIATVFRSAKGVRFARIKQLENPSPQRIPPCCPHYDRCNSCDYLHTSYQQELNFKKENYQRYIGPNQYFEVHSASDRLNYRNRIQLHYNKKKLGFISPSTKEIIKVPHCLLPTKEIQAKLKQLYKNWPQEALPPKGHLEIYHPPEENIQVTFNQPYAAGGFSQVNAKMNACLTQIVAKNLEEKATLDLFGGDGNLTNSLSASRWIVDRYTTPYSKNFIDYNLFDDKAPEFISQKIKRNISQIVIDPPRAGFKNIHAFVEHFHPEKIIYVSCNIATQMRDLKNIDRSYQIQQCHLIDLFPATAHFESIIILTRL